MTSLCRLWAHLFWVPKLRMEIQKSIKTRFKFYKFRSILSLKISVQRWFLGLLLWTPCLRALQNLQKPQSQRRKIDLWSYHCPNYFSRTAPGVFMNVLVKIKSSILIYRIYDFKHILHICTFAICQGLLGPRNFFKITSSGLLENAWKIKTSFRNNKKIKHFSETKQNLQSKYNKNKINLDMASNYMYACMHLFYHHKKKCLKYK